MRGGKGGGATEVRGRGEELMAIVTRFDQKKSLHPKRFVTSFARKKGKNSLSEIYNENLQRPQNL